MTGRLSAIARRASSCRNATPFADSTTPADLGLGQRGERGAEQRDDEIQRHERRDDRQLLERGSRRRAQLADARQHGSTTLPGTASAGGPAPR